MARYTYSFTVAVSMDRLRQLMKEVLQSCNLDLIYDQSDCMMAREQPGQVSLSKLVTVEVLFDRITASQTATTMSIVIKNDELALMVDNHCHRVFESVKQSILENRNWQIVEIVG